MNASVDSTLAELERTTAAGREGLAALRDEVRDALNGPLEPVHRAEGEQCLAAYDEALALVDLELAEVRWMREGWRRVERFRVRFEEIAAQLGRIGQEVDGG